MFLCILPDFELPTVAFCPVFFNSQELQKQMAIKKFLIKLVD